MNTNMSGNQAGCSAPQRGPRGDVERLSDALQGAQNEIEQLNRQHGVRAAAWQKERMKLGYRIHNGKYKVDRLEGLIDLRQNSFAEELQTSIQTISKQESEISGLKISLRIKEEQMEAAQRLNKEQVEKLSAALQAERQNVSELRDQIFKASLESQRTAAQNRESEMKLELMKQQLQLRDKVILDVRKEKEGLSERVIQTSDQLRRKNNEILQKNTGEEKLKALQEQFSKEMEDKKKELTSKINEVQKENRDMEENNQTLTSRVTEVEKDNQDLVKKQDTLKTRVLEVEKDNQDLVKKQDTLKTRVLEVESENIRLSEQERTLTSRVREEEEEKGELILLMTLKKRNFFTRIFKRETNEEKTLRKRLSEKKKELKDKKKEEENRQREEAEEEKRRKVEAEKELKKQQKREKEEKKQKEKDEKKKEEETRDKKSFWRFRKRGNENTKVEEAAEEQQ